MCYSLAQRSRWGCCCTDAAKLGNYSPCCPSHSSRWRRLGGFHLCRESIWVHQRSAKKRKDAERTGWRNKQFLQSAYAAAPSPSSSIEAIAAVRGGDFLGVNASIPGAPGRLPPQPGDGFGCLGVRSCDRCCCPGRSASHPRGSGTSHGGYGAVGAGSRGLDVGIYVDSYGGAPIADVSREDRQHGPPDQAFWAPMPTSVDSGVPIIPQRHGSPELKEDRDGKESSKAINACGSPVQQRGTRRGGVTQTKATLPQEAKSQVSSGSLSGKDHNLSIEPDEVRVSNKRELIKDGLLIGDGLFK